MNTIFKYNANAKYSIKNLKGAHNSNNFSLLDVYLDEKKSLVKIQLPDIFRDHHIVAKPRSTKAGDEWPLSLAHISAVIIKKCFCLENCFFLDKYKTFCIRNFWNCVGEFVLLFFLEYVYEIFLSTNIFPECPWWFLLSNKHEIFFCLKNFFSGD